MKRKIIAVTGARSEYGLLVEVFKKLAQDDEIDFSIIVTGAHLSEKYGETIQFIEQDGFHIEDKIYNLIESDKKIGRVISLGNQIQSLAQSFERLNPDIVLIAGDREESLSVTLTAAYMAIPCAHFYGGDITKDGNIDNSVRYAASKLATIHFPSLHEHRETLIKLGEEPSNIFVMGNPAIDRFLSTKKLDFKDLMSRLNVEKQINKYFVLIQHPIITQVEEQGKHIRETLDAIVESETFCFLNYPNSDSGNQSIINAYNEYKNKYPNLFYIFKNLDRTSYVNLLRHASCLLGNSSSGIVEVASLGLPVINIGSRQRGRITGKNVLFVDNDSKKILEAIHYTQTDKEYITEVNKKVNPYGDGNSSSYVLEVLKSIELNDSLIYKNITY